MMFSRNAAALSFCALVALSGCSSTSTESAPEATDSTDPKTVSSCSTFAVDSFEEKIGQHFRRTISTTGKDAETVREELDNATSDIVTLFNRFGAASQADLNAFITQTCGPHLEELRSKDPEFTRPSTASSLVGLSENPSPLVAQGLQLCGKVDKALTDLGLASEPAAQPGRTKKKKSAEKNKMTVLNAQDTVFSYQQVLDEGLEFAASFAGSTTQAELYHAAYTHLCADLVG